MSENFFETPILNSPYAYPNRHWELDKDGQPTNHVMEFRRPAKTAIWLAEVAPNQGKRGQDILDYTRRANEQDGYLRCTGNTYPAQVLYDEIAAMACERIKSAISQTYLPA